MTGFLDSVGLVVLDFDETITAKDTISTISSIAYAKKPTFKPEWSYFSECYLNDYAKVKQDFGPISTLEDQKKFFDEVRAVERASLQRIEKSGLFKGLLREDLAHKAPSVPLRAGWQQFFSRVKSLKIPIVILSINWSAFFISQVLQDFTVPIYANELELDSQGQTTGRIVNELLTGNDKQKQVIKIIEKYRDQIGDKKVAYFGDSLSDLIAMLDCDIPVAVGKPDIPHAVKRLNISADLRFISDFNDSSLT